MKRIHLKALSLSLSLSLSLLLITASSISCGKPDKADSAKAETKKSETTDSKARIITAQGGLNLRAKPDSSGEKIALIPDGEKVELLEETGSDMTISGSTGKWSRIKWNDKSGWAFGGFLKQVSAGGSQAPARFIENGPGMVKDTSTGETWQKCTAGLSGPDCTTGEALLQTWENAKSYCRALRLGGRTNWQLPIAGSLQSIVNLDRKPPMINTTVFPGTKSANYWIFFGSERGDRETDAGYINFANGQQGGGRDNTKGTNYFRCNSHSDIY